MSQVSDQWCRTTNNGTRPESQTPKTTFTWTIEEFKNRPEKNGEKMSSTVFLARGPNEKTTSWKLEFFPKGKKETDNEAEQEMSIFLHNCNDFPLKAKYKVSILDSSSKKTTTFDCPVTLFASPNSSDNSAWGRIAWVSRQSIINNTEMLPEGHLTLLCVLTVIGGTEKPTGSKDVETNTNARGLEQVSEHLEKLFNCKEFSDVEIECDGEIFNCHMNILSTRSDVFRAMFQADMTENRTKKVTIKDIDSDVVRGMLLFIYTGATNGNVFKEKSRELFAAANMYQLDILKNICEDHLCSDLQINNAIENLIFGDTHQASKLRRMAMRVIARNIVKLVGTEEYQDLVKHHSLLAAEIPKALVEDKMIKQ